MVDYADAERREAGDIQSVRYEEMYNKRVAGDITLAADGSFSFSFSSLFPEQLTGTQNLVITATDWNDNPSTAIVTLFDKVSGPAIQMDGHGPADYNVYSSALDQDLVFTGLVGLPTFTLTYEVEPEFGADVPATVIGYTSGPSGSSPFSFTFNPVAKAVSGSLTFVLRANDGKPSSTTFILSDDPTPPAIPTSSIAGNNASVTLGFSEGIYHAGGTDPLAADFAVSDFNAGGGTASGVNILGFAGAPPAAGATSITLNIAVVGTPDGHETFRIRPAAAALTDRVGNPMPVTNTSGLLTLADQAGPQVTQVSSTAAAGSAHKAGASLVLTVQFNETVVVTGTPVLALNTGTSATCTGGSGTSTLSFSYTVGAGQNADPLDYTGTGSLTVAMGGITDPLGNPAGLTLPVPGSAGSLASRNLRIDTINPAQPNVAVAAGGDGIINIAENTAGAPFTIDLAGEAGSTYTAVLSANAALASGALTGTLDGAGAAPAMSLRTTAAGGAGSVTVTVTITDRAGNVGPARVATTSYNLTAPTAPTVSGATPTNNTTPEWTWTGGGGGNGTYRYKLNDPDLSQRGHRDHRSELHARHRPHRGYLHPLRAGTQHACRQLVGFRLRAVVIDLTPPTAPTVSGADADQRHHPRVELDSAAAPTRPAPTARSSTTPTSPPRPARAPPRASRRSALSARPPTSCACRSGTRPATGRRWAPPRRGASTSRSTSPLPPALVHRRHEPPRPTTPPPPGSGRRRRRRPAILPLRAGRRR